MGIKILIAEDDLNYRELVADLLRYEGHEVIEAEDGCEAIDLFFYHNNIDLVILDVMMPKFDGWEVCSEIRKISEVPILMLTALREEKNEVYGLNIGADEFISKPFSYNVFMARVNSMIRRIRKENESNLQFEELVINQCSRTVKVDNKVLNLSPKEYKLLIFLVKNMGRALSRDQILNYIWGYDFYGDRRNVDTYIKSLRAKLGIYSDYIQTVRGLGYKFEVKE